MGTFSSLDSGEAILGVSTKNPDAGCSKSPDAAGMAGAAIATAGLLATAAVTKIGLSLAASGLKEGQAAAEKVISDALSNASTSADAAADNALAAVNAGPGSDADAQIQKAKTEVASAQTDAMKLANEKKAGADSKIADALAKVNSAKQYLIEKQVEAVSLIANAPQIALDMGAAMGKAALQSAPIPKPPTLPIPAPTPIPALPTRVPVPAVAVPAAVTKPPEAVVISAPKVSGTSTTSSKLIKTTDTTETMTVADESLKQKVLSKDQIDKCKNRREQLCSSTTNWPLQAYGELLISDLQQIEKYVKPQTVTAKIQDGKKFVALYPFFETVLRTGKQAGGWNWNNFIVTDPNTISIEVGDTLGGALVGWASYGAACQSAADGVRYYLTCEQLEPIEKWLETFNAESRGNIKLLSEIRQALEEFIEDDTSVIEDQLSKLLDSWLRLTKTAQMLPAEFWASGTYPKSKT